MRRDEGVRRQTDRRKRGGHRGHCHSFWRPCVARLLVWVPWSGQNLDVWVCAGLLDNIRPGFQNLLCAGSGCDPKQTASRIFEKAVLRVVSLLDNLESLKTSTRRFMDWCLFDVLERSQSIILGFHSYTEVNSFGKFKDLSIKLEVFGKAQTGIYRQFTPTF